MVLGRGFDDNVGRNLVFSLFEVCLWCKEDLKYINIYLYVF